MELGTTGCEEASRGNCRGPAACGRASPGQASYSTMPACLPLSPTLSIDESPTGQLQLLPSFTSPLPLYRALVGNLQSGMVRKTVLRSATRESTPILLPVASS